LANRRPPPPASSGAYSSINQPETNSQPTTNSGRRELMKIQIDLSDTQTETLLIREGETALQVARAFCQKFSLPEETEFLLRD